MNMQPDHTRFSILSSFENVADLAEEVSNYFAARPGSDPELIDSLRLCLAEALNNVVEHAYDGMEGKPIYADVHAASDRYEIQIIDEGRAMPGNEPPEGTSEIDVDDFENLPEGGFGWMLIRTLMDDVEYERRDSCNVLRLGKNV